jgi:hypothetical protein
MVVSKSDVTSGLPHLKRPISRFRHHALTDGKLINVSTDRDRAPLFMEPYDETMVIVASSNVISSLTHP